MDFSISIKVSAVALLPIDMVKIFHSNVPPNVDFYIGRFQVTQHQWQKVMTGNTNNISVTPSWFREGGNGAGQVTGLATANFPVERVSWFEALVFSNRLSIQQGRTPVYSINGSENPDDWGPVPTVWYSPNIGEWYDVTIVSGNGYRLPTSEQWNFAALAGTMADFHNGVNFVGESITAPLVAPIAWIRYNSGGRTRQVGTRAANAWGLHDMHGNVWEWCWDAFVDKRRVLHGGSWFNYASSARPFVWNLVDPWNSGSLTGLRIVRHAN